MRQLVVGEADRRPSECVEDVVERIGVDGRGQPIPDRCRPDRDPRRLAPGVGGRVVGELEGQQDCRVRADRVGIGRSVDGPGPAKLRRLGKPVEGLALAGQFDDADGGRQEVEQRAEQWSTCRRLGLRRRRRSGREPRSAARVGRPARHRACLTRSARRSSVARGGIGLKAQRPRAGETSAMGLLEPRELGRNLPESPRDLRVARGLRRVDRLGVMEELAGTTLERGIQGEWDDGFRGGLGTAREGPDRPPNDEPVLRSSGSFERARWIALAVTPVPSNRRASSNVNRRSPAFDAPKFVRERNRRSP